MESAVAKLRSSSAFSARSPQFSEAVMQQQLQPQAAKNKHARKAEVSEASGGSSCSTDRTNDNRNQNRQKCAHKYRISTPDSYRRSSTPQCTDLPATFNTAVNTNTNYRLLNTNRRIKTPPKYRKCSKQSAVQHRQSSRSGGFQTGHNRQARSPERERIKAETEAEAAGLCGRGRAGPGVLTALQRLALFSFPVSDALDSPG
ncbi:hypothetical protein AOLI_G00175230 [Acnodon oligacanthus]